MSKRKPRKPKLLLVEAGTGVVWAGGEWFVTNPRLTSPPFSWPLVAAKCGNDPPCPANTNMIHSHQIDLININLS